MLLQEIKNLKSSPRELKRFGMTVGIILLASAAFLFWKVKESFLYVGAVGGIFVVVGLLLPNSLKLIYLVWMTIAVIMGFLMTRVILAILFFGMFTPIALLAKLLGKDLLQQRWDKNASTYWVKREAGEYQPRSAERMF